MARFHPHEFACPQCHTKAEVTEVLFRADGFVRLEGVCMECEIELSSETEISEVLSWAAIFDEFPVNVHGRRADC